MARVSTGLFSLAAIILMSAFASAQCETCNADHGCPGGSCSTTSTNNCCPWNRPYTEESSPDVFYNFYQPGNGGSPAAAFPAPHPTPAHVGHQYTTYQPFMPNEWLYWHHRTYHQPYNMGKGLNRTKVVWYGTPVRIDLMTVRKFFSLPR